MRSVVVVSALHISACLAGCSETAVNTPANVLKIVVSAGGDITVQGQASSLEQLSLELAKLKESEGTVWYYRENPEDEPHPNALKVIQMVIDNELPIRLCVKPDFSEDL